MNSISTPRRYTTAIHHGDTPRRYTTAIFGGVLLICLLCHHTPVRAQSTNTELAVFETGLQRLSLKVQRAERDGHSQTWNRIETFRDSDGNEVTQTNLAFMELQTGMHHLENGAWKESREVIEPFEGGAIARLGQHKVIFAENLNTAGAIDMETPDSKRLRSHVLGLAYADTASGKSVFIAELRNSSGIIANSNQVIYVDAFTGVKADVRYTYTKSGFEQDIIVRAQLPSPANFGLDPKTTWLQVFTEFLDSPQPVKEHVSFRDSQGKEVADELLDFGDMRIGVGRAFSVGAEHRTTTTVSKRWVNVDGRAFLIEEVPLPEIASELEALPKSASLSRPNKAAGMAKLDRSLPHKPKNSVRRGKMLLAKLDAGKPGFVLDYAMINGNLQNYTLKGDTTYYISGNVVLLNTTTIEGGTVVKYAPGTSIQLSSLVVCKTGPYRPAIFTARDDDTVGEILVGISTGTPSGFYASTALAAPSYSSPSLSYLRISYASQGLVFTYVGGPGLTVRNVQIVNCQIGIATYNCSMGIKVRNALFKNVGTVFSMYSGYSAGTPDAQHITVDGSTWLWATSHPYGQGIFKNCVFANVVGLVNPSGPATVGGANNGFYNTPAFGSSQFPSPGNPFQTVGAGTCYLDGGSGFLNVGLGPPTIDATLATELTRKTTTAPQNISDNQTVPTGTSWFQTVTRDTDTLDLGYHYDPLDVCVSRATLGGTLTINPGTAIGYFGLYGFRNGTLTIQGSPLNRSTVAHYSAVQEQPIAWGADASATYLLKSGTMPALICRFTDITTAGGPTFGGGWVNNLNIAHSTLFGARLSYDTGGPMPHAFTNNVIERCNFNYGMCGGPGYGIQFCNNLILNTSFSAGYYCYQPPGVSAHNNLFANSSFSYHSLPGQGPQISHNGYHNSAVPIQGTSPVTINTLDFQSGALGPYYYPTTVNGQNLATLVNAGSTTADVLNLCPFTTRTDQTREGTSQVDIGFHYVALDTFGNPQDNNGNGLPDFDETPVANPQTVSPSVCRDTARTITLTGSGNSCTPLTFIIVSGPAHGTLNTVTSTGDTSADVTYTPTPLYCGPDSFTFKVRNNGRDSAPATVTFTVGDPNPIANCQDVMTGKNTPVTITLSGTDTCNDTLTFTVVNGSGPNSGTLIGSGATLTYTPNTSTFEGTDGFDYIVDNCGSSSQPAHVTINVVASPKLVATCGPDRVLLRWTISPQAAALATDFQIKRATSAGGPYTVIHTASSTDRSFTDTSVTQGTLYCYVITVRHQDSCSSQFWVLPSNEVCLSTCTEPPCGEERISEWVFTDLGFINGGQNGSFRIYSDPSSVLASPWNFQSIDQRSLRIDFEKDNSCVVQHGGPSNPNRQVATAEAAISVGCLTRMTINWSGMAEQQQPELYELMTLYVGNSLLADAHAPGGGLGCAVMAPAIPRTGTPASPQYIDLNPGIYILRINVDTFDAQYHYGAFYEFNFAFQPQ